MEFIGLSSVLSFFGAWQGEEVSLNFVAKFIQWMNSGIGIYGVTVILFTVILKIVTFPLDVWQRVLAKKNAVITKEIAPMMNNVEKRYPNDKNMQNQEKQKIMKKMGYSPASSCLPLIVTLVVFGIMFTGLNSYSAYVNVNNYMKLESEYNKVYYDITENSTTYEAYTNAYNEEYPKSYDYYLEKFTAEADKKTTEEEIIELAKEEASYRAMIKGQEAATEIIDAEGTDESRRQAAQLAVGTLFKNEIQEDFLWIKNIWRPDTWENVMVDSDKFVSGGSGAKALTSLEGFSVKKYDYIREGVLKENPGYFAYDKNGNMVRDGWNGLILLPVLAMAIMFLSSWLSQKQNSPGGTDKNDPAQRSAKSMMFIMPIMFGIFGFFYTAAFSVYLVSNSLWSIIVNLVTTPWVNKLAEKSLSKKSGIEDKASYMR